GQVTHARMVPASAVVPGLTAKDVFVVQEGKVVRRTGRTGMRTASKVHITEGLAAGDVVITSGTQQLRAGQPVSVAAADDVVPAAKNGGGENSGGKPESKMP